MSQKETQSPQWNASQFSQQNKHSPQTALEQLTHGVRSSWRKVSQQTQSTSSLVEQVATAEPAAEHDGMTGALCEDADVGLLRATAR